MGIEGDVPSRYIGEVDIKALCLLVGGFNHLEKYEFVNGKDDIQCTMENEKCSKAPTSLSKWWLTYPP